MRRHFDSGYLEGQGGSSESLLQAAKLATHESGQLVAKVRRDEQHDARLDYSMVLRDNTKGLFMWLYCTCIEDVW